MPSFCRKTASNSQSPDMDLQNLSRMILGIHLADGINDNTLFIDDIGSTQRALGHFAVHLLLAPSLVDFQDGQVGISDKMER